MGVINTEQLDKIDAQLSGITQTLDDIFAELQNQIDSAGSTAQQILDDKAEEVSQKMTEKLNPIRQAIIDCFHAQVEKIEEKIAPIEPILSMFPISISLDTSCLTAIVDALTAIKDIIVAPYTPYIELITTIVPKIMSISANIQKIVNYSPTLNLPDGVTMPSLTIDVAPITPNDIL